MQSTGLHDTCGIGPTESVPAGAGSWRPCVHSCCFLHRSTVAGCALEAVSALSRSLEVARETASPDTQAEIQRGVGLSIGTIEVELLSILSRMYPELDQLED